MSCEALVYGQYILGNIYSISFGVLLLMDLLVIRKILKHPTMETGDRVASGLGLGFLFLVGLLLLLGEGVPRIVTPEFYVIEIAQFCSL